MWINYYQLPKIILLVILLLANGCEKNKYHNTTANKLNVKLYVIVEKEFYSYDLSNSHQLITVPIKEKEFNSIDVNIKNAIINSFESAGFTIVNNMSNDSDAILKIKIKYISYGFHDTGTEISGNISFITSDGFSFEKTFERDSEPLNTIIYHKDVGLEDAILREQLSCFVWTLKQSNFFEELGKLIEEHYGKESLTGYWIGLKHGMHKYFNFRYLTSYDIFNHCEYLYYNQPYNLLCYQFIKTGAPAVNILIKALKDYDIDIQDDAVISLGVIKDKRAIEPLIRALKDERMRYEANISLVKITGKDFRGNYYKWRVWFLLNKLSRKMVRMLYWDQERKLF